jgi:uncharacterized membrane protein
MSKGDTWMTTQAPGECHESSRDLAFDLARGLAMLFMILVHTWSTHARPELRPGLFGATIEFLGSPPSAPVFMFLMGTGTAFANDTNVTRGLKRAFRLFLLGYALNVIRGAVPLWLALRIGKVTAEQVAPYTPLSELLAIDILQLAGLAYAVCVLLKHYVPIPRFWVGLSVLVGCVSPLVWKFSDGQQGLLAQVFAPIGGSTAQNVYFPVFPWLAYPLLGMAFGAWLKASRDKLLFHRRALLWGLLLLAAGTAVTLTDSTFHIGDYYRSGPGSVLWIGGFLLVWLWFCRVAVQRVAPNRFFERMYFWSRSVTPFYFIQWGLIAWLRFLVGSEELGLWQVLIAMACVGVATDRLTYVWQRLTVSAPLAPSSLEST